MKSKSFWFLFGILVGCVLMIAVIFGAVSLGQKAFTQPKVVLGISI